jgi:hypothetical protein
MVTSKTAVKTAAKKASTKTAAKAPVKTAAQAKTTVKKAAPRKAVKPATPNPKTTATKPAQASKPSKVKKPKLVRDSFTMPKDEYVVIDSLKLRGGKLGQAVKKSELLRAGIKALAAMSDIQFKAALSNVPTIKTGRPTRAK